MEFHLASKMISELILPSKPTRRKNLPVLIVLLSKLLTNQLSIGIREACRIGREVLDLAGRAVRVGVTCDELDRIVHEATVERGAYPSPLNYYKFPKSVCTSVNEVICHGIASLLIDWLTFNFFMFLGN